MVNSIKNKKLRILYLLQEFPKLSETFILNEIIHLEKLGGDVTILARKKPSGKIHPEVIKNNLLEKTYYTSVENFNRGSGKLLFFLLKLFKEMIINPFKTTKHLKYLIITHRNFWSACDSFFSLKKILNKKFDLIHCSFSTYDKIENAYFISKLLNCNFSLSFRAYELYQNKYSREMMKRKFMIEESSKIITISEYNQKYLKKILGIKKVPIVHDAINTELFKPSIKKSSNKIITIGRFVEQKGMDFLIEACNILNKNKVSYNCVIIGDGPLKKQYVEKIKKYEIPNIVFKGSLNSKEVKSELASSSVFVLPCIIASDGDRDILPNVLKEAMAMEIPIVTSNICGIKELVENGVSGLLVPTKNSEAVANAIRKILENPDFGRKLGFAGRLKIKKNYDIEKESKKLQTIFQEGCL